ncbi:MAG TPA: hypothetical protein VKA15_03510 [Isosphaeraceae bacterium]|nr:hypothetical protein [Isosphaeraceae bacterium]
MIRLIRAFAAAIVLLGLTTTRARADLTINLSDITLGANNTGTMDISATTSSGFTLSQFGLELAITSIGSPMTQLQFSSPQPDSAFIYSNPNYVFSGQSFNAANGDLPFWNLPTPAFAPVDILGGDSVASIFGMPPGYVSIAGGSTVYLATVQFYIPQGTQLNQFQVSLVNGPNTYFYDQNGNPLPYTTGVPEPSTLTVVALSGLSGLLWCSWRGRKRRQSKNSYGS